MSKEDAIKILKNICEQLPKEVIYEDALHTYYNNYDVEDLIFIIIDVLNGVGYDIGDHAI